MSDPTPMPELPHEGPTRSPREHRPDPAGSPHWAPMAARLDALLPEIDGLEPIGRGGAGWVFRGRRADRPVAIKVLTTPEGPGRDRWEERFEREVEALERLDHPGIVRILGAGMDDDLAWIVMDLVEGTTLRSLMAEGPLPSEEALAIARGMAEALDHAHRRGVVHRDVKPENVLVDEDGQVRLVDFGLARLVAGETGSAALTRPTQALGTLRYMAPEQLDAPSEVDHRADVYSLGVVVYEMLTGVVPHGVVEAPSRVAGVSRQLDRGVLRALSRDPDGRPESAMTLLAELDLDPTRESEREERRRNRRIDLAILAVFTGVPAVVLTIILPETGVLWGLWGLLAATALIVNSPAVVRLVRGSSAAPLARFVCGSTIWLLMAPGVGPLTLPHTGYAVPLTLIAGTVQLAAVPFSRVGPAGWRWSSAARGRLHVAATLAAMVALIWLAVMTGRSGGSALRVYFMSLPVALWLTAYVVRRRNSGASTRTSLIRSRALALLSWGLLWVPIFTAAPREGSIQVIDMFVNVQLFGAILILAAVDGLGTSAHRR